MPKIAVAFNPWQAFSRPALGGIRAFLSARLLAGDTPSNTPPGSVAETALVDVYSRWIDDFPELISRAQCAGLILSVSANDYAAIRDRLPPGLPHVNCGAELPTAGIPCVVPDARWQINLAAQHLIDGGCRSIGYVGLTDSAICSTHVRCLNERLINEEIKLSTAWLTWPRDEKSDPPRPTPEFQKWLVELPRPCGIIASTYAFAAWAVHTYLARHIAIPDAAAVLSVLDGDTCEMSHPSITALRTDGFQMGWESMRLLQLLLDGEPADARPTLVGSIQLVQRESTSSPSEETRVVQAALDFIEANYQRKIGSADVVRHVGGISRTKFYELFSARVGRSVAAQIRVVRLDEACRLLATTEATVAEIAEKSGFSSGKQLAQLLRRETGLTPGAYRRKRQEGESVDAFDSVRMIQPRENLPPEPEEYRPRR